MTGGMPVALRLSAVEGVLDHGAAKQHCRQRMRSLQPPRGGIKQIVEVAVDLIVPSNNEVGSLSMRRPFLKEVQRNREIPEMEGVLHRALFCQHVLEVGQCLEVGAQAFNRKTLLESCPTQPLGVLDLAGGDQRIDVDAFPLCLGTIPATTIEVVIVQVTSSVAFLGVAASRTATASLARPAWSSRRAILCGEPARNA
jgi:hypothetical protein